VQEEEVRRGSVKNEPTHLDFVYVNKKKLPDNNEINCCLRD
jgi:hypothetical protein